MLKMSTSEECLVREKYCKDSTPNENSVPMININAEVFSDDP